MLGGRQETQKTGGDTMTEANQSFDARRMAREQESRMAATASMGINVAHIRSVPDLDAAGIRRKYRTGGPQL
jgi:hypothetical protein